MWIGRLNMKILALIIYALVVSIVGYFIYMFIVNVLTVRHTDNKKMIPYLAPIFAVCFTILVTYMIKTFELWQ